ncbi:acetyltransferase [Desulfosarcina sp. BuS5]|uniref:bifunctional acetate--CoA ligase family protein/GNAT family N-acetyltransferase n=1 Tax=Desulfosarcina sp. BuS5 TaxID=933262 RepID=UPI000557FD70|nr:bifunctional acetate--CoA ligase family protein/GNAT family N-acetyltransferase [Desulfosarcina sp. BuS5]WDN87253.1 acetyltransferase [Desulfosarcina sp. BuS5]
MGVENINRMFQPKSVAVVGASERPGSIGNALMRNLIKSEFSGTVYPVNPNHKTIWKHPAYPSVQDIKASIDLVIISTPIVTAPQIVRCCVDSEAGGVVIISAGGKETGTSGKKIEAAIKKEIKHSGLRVIGPNCLGIVCGKAALNASFASHMPLKGKMAFISQSGAICTSILDLSIKEQFGFSYFISLGSMLDVDFGDMIDYLGGDPEVSSIVMYIEGLNRFRNFMSAARAVSRVKPIVALKSGRTRAGAKAAASHTGSMAGEDTVYDAAFRRAGIVRVKTFEELFDCAELLAKQPRPRGSGLAVITNAGGPGVMAADALADYGIEPAALLPETAIKLEAILPSYWNCGNPIDILGDAAAERYNKVVEICLNAREINGLLIMLSPVAQVDPADIAESIIGLLGGKKIPVITSWIGGSYVEAGRKIFNKAGIPTFDTPERAIRAFMDLDLYAKNIEMLQEIPSKFPKKLEFDRKKAKELVNNKIEAGEFNMTEIDSLSLLEAYGIPVNPAIKALSAKEAGDKAEATGFPVVIKINSKDISHKTDAGGIALNIKNKAEAIDSFANIMRNAKEYNPEAVIEGVTIQPMVNDVDYELILGAKKDHDFGPVILFGMGGTLTEVIKDMAIALPPINRLLARRLMEQTKVYSILQGFRSRPPADLVFIEEILIRLSQMVTDIAEIEELDINPLVIKQGKICAVDARVILKPADIPAPFHLVISPYPNQHEEIITHPKLGELLIRPIRPDDATLLENLFNTLSPQSVYHRFFGYLKRLPHSMLARFTQIDYDREIAFVALSNTKDGEIMLGAARVITQINRKHAEFAVLVGDPWQGKGIGAELLKRCLAIAREHGIEKVWGMVLYENTQMLSLSKKIGFTIKKNPGAGVYELNLELGKAKL